MGVARPGNGYCGRLQDSKRRARARTPHAPPDSTTTHLLPHPQQDPADPRNFRKTIQRIMSVKYSFPSNLHLSRECLDLISRIFVANPHQRMSIEQASGTGHGALANGQHSAAVAGFGQLLQPPLVHHFI